MELLKSIFVISFSGNRASNLGIFIFRRRWLIFSVILLITLFFAYQLRNLRVYGEFDAWFKSGDPVLVSYQEFVASFGDDENLVLIYRPDTLFSKSQLALNLEMTRQISAFREVERVVSISSFQAYLPGNPDQLKQRITAMPLLVNNLISRDGTATGILIFPGKAASGKELLAKVNALAEELRTTGVMAHVFGPFAIKEEVHKLATREAGLFLLIAVGIMFFMMLLILKKILLAIIPVLLALISVVWTLGVFVLLGQTMNVVTSIMPLVLLVISIAFSVHFIFSYISSGNKSRSKEETVQQVFRDVLVPCFFSGLTTAFAFLVFGLSEIKPLILFGVFSALGVIFAFSLTFLLLPTLLGGITALPEKPSTPPAARILRFESLALWVKSKRLWIIFSSVVILILAVSGITRIEFSADQLRYFKVDHQVSKANRAAESWFEGVYPTEIVVDLGHHFTENPGRSYQILKQIDLAVVSMAEVTSRQSPLVAVESLLPGGISESTWIKYVSNIPDPNQWLAEGPGALLRPYISEDGHQFRVSVRTPWMGSQETIDFIESLDSRLSTQLTEWGVTYYFTGMTSMLSTMNQRLIGSQVISISGALVAIFLVLLLIYRRFSLTLAGMVPNLFPIVTTLGIMGWLGIPLDVATVLLASISLGIAIDDTVHFLSVYIKSLANRNRVESIALSYIRVGKPISVTTLLLACGFLVMAFSNYMPIVYLGIFVSLNIVLALVYDLILLPALLLRKPDT